MKSSEKDGDNNSNSNSNSKRSGNGKNDGTHSARISVVRFECDDRYEAEKLASLVSVQKDGSVYVAGVAAVIGGEVVIKLKDKSSHAVVLKDAETARRLHSFLQQVARGSVAIESSDFAGSVAEIVIAVSERRRREDEGREAQDQLGEG